MFKNLENFLSAKITDKEQNEEDLLTTNTNTSINDSWDLDLSMPTSKNLRKGDGEKSKNQSTSFVPAKGQKTAAKRLQKIGDTLAKDMEYHEIQQVEKTKAKKPKTPPKRSAVAARQSPKGRGGRRTASSRSRSRYIDFGELDSSDSDVHERAPRSTYDPNTIVLDCDDEFFGGPAVNVTRNLAAATAVSTDESMELTVSVNINGKIEKYQMNSYQKISVLITRISEQKLVPADHIALMFKDKTITPQETPNSIDYIQGLVMRAHISDMVKNNASSRLDKRPNENQLEIKIQSEGRRRPFITYIGPTDELTTLAFACAEEFKCEIDKVIIEFDGEFINFKDTADDLGLEGGEVMDFYKKST